MSVKIMSFVWERTDLSQHEKLVFLALADHANDDGLCWPSLERIAVKACCSVDGASRTIERFAKEGWLKKQRRARATTLYRIDVHRLTMNRPGVESSSDESTLPRDGSILNGHDSTPGVELIPILKPSLEPPKEEGARAPSTAAQLALSSEINPETTPLEDILKLYHQYCIKLPKVKRFDERRKRSVRQRWREDKERQTLAWWAKYFSFVNEKCPFLTGDNDRGWVADFDFLMKPANMVKIIENGYVRRRTTQR